MEEKCTDAQLLEFWNLLDVTAAAIERAREKELKQYDLTMVQSKVLISLWLLDHDPTLGELSRWLYREQSSTSYIAEQMAARGSIRKYRDPEKKRVTRIGITGKGEAEFNKIASRETLLQVLSVLSHEECLLLRDNLKRILSQVKSETGIGQGPAYGQLMVDILMQLYGGKDSNTGIVPDTKIEGINHNHLLLDIIYSYCPPDQFVVWVYLDQTRYSISRAMSLELMRHELSLIQSKVLSALTIMPRDPTLGELSGWLFREHNSTSEITDRMAAKGLVRKYQDPDEKRRTRVAITDKGKRINIGVVSKGNTLKVLSFLGAEECERIKTSLRKLFTKATAVADTATPGGSGE